MRRGMPQGMLQELPGKRTFHPGDFFRRPGRNNLTTTGAAFGSKVNNPVCSFDNIQVVFDHDDGVSMIPKSMNDLEQLLDIMEV